MGKHCHGRQKKHYKDTLKAFLKDINIPIEPWDKLHRTEQRVPCFPSSKARVVEPEPVPHKHVHRYGETNIRHLDSRPREQWQKSGKYQERQLPGTPRIAVEAEPHQLRRQPEAHLSSRTYTETQRSPRSQSVMYETPRSLGGPPSYQAPPPPREEASVRHRPPRPKTADFFVSVPIFHESMNHSYRKKNCYVYRDSPRDQDALLHQSLTRASSIRSLDRSYSSRPRSGQVECYRKQRGHRRPHSADVDRYYDDRHSRSPRHNDDRRRKPDRYFDDRYSRSGNMYIQTLPADAYSTPRRRPESHREVEYGRPHSAQMERHRSDERGRRSRKHANPREVEYRRPRAQHVERTEDYYGPVYMKERPRSQQRSQGTSKRQEKSTSDMSYDCRASVRSYGSTYSYESERFDRAVRLKKAPSSIGISIDSDNEDYR